MESSVAVIGAQWGDEGKGKMVDRYARRADWVVRYQGGNNAGHTVVVEGEKFVLHLIPSGILHEGTRCLIGPGMVVNLRELQDEIATLREANVPVEERLRIAPRAHVLFPFHQFRDAEKESERGEEKIGTTKKGIGPAYEDKVRRSGLRMVDLHDPDRVESRVRRRLEELSPGWEDFDGSTPEELTEEYRGYFEQLKPLLRPAPETLAEARANDRNILFEGAQGTHLDIDFGSYPYVTSSNPTVGGVVTGSGFPGHYLESVVGIAKAYTTRVGKGPFPAELTGETGERLREEGGEFGATTGRPRRCGWLDLPLLKLSCRVNGFTEIVLTKLDVLSGFSTVNMAVEYDGRDRFPARNEELGRVTPVYREFEGWEEDITGARNWDDLPSGAQQYVEFVERELEVPIRTISVGPGREQAVER